MVHFGYSFKATELVTRGTAEDLRERLTSKGLAVSVVEEETKKEESSPA
jgi:hypothetical protein